MSPLPCAASSLLVDLVAKPPAMVEVVHTPVSVHYETGRDDVPVLCISLPTAVRLPNAALVDRLPTGPPTLRVTRWWQPPRPHGLSAAVRTLDLDPLSMIGRGDGLTPSGDDVLAGALVAASAVAHPSLHSLRDGVRAALVARRTTAVSRGLLTHALEGWSTPELAAYVEAVCSRADVEAAEERLLRVGSSSGAALRDGVLAVVDAGVREVAA